MLVSGNSEETPRRLLEQVLTTSPVNLASSNTSSVAAAIGKVERVDLPESFFVESAALSGILGLAPPPRPFVPSTVYAESLRTFEMRLTDDDQFWRPGDTHFAFVVPKRAFEDTDTLRKAIERGILSRTGCVPADGGLPQPDLLAEAPEAPRTRARRRLRTG